MRTDQLIDLLVADLKPVDRGRISRALVMALAIGVASAFGAMFLLHGPRPVQFGSENSSFLFIKLLFTLSVVVTSAAFLPQLARPGAEGQTFSVFVSLPFVAMATLAAVALASSHRSSWGGMIVGNDWLTCLFSIPLFAIVPFAAVVWALHTGAPTDRTRAGAIAGLVAGGLSATACALPCADDSFPSIALWYGLTIGICTSFGAMLGPRLLRW